jgi:hypothetical protein
MRPDLGLLDALAVGLLGAGCLLMAGTEAAARVLKKVLEHGRRPSIFDGEPRPMARKVRR